MSSILAEMGLERPDAEVPTIQPRTDKQMAVIAALQGYIREAEDMRKSGENPRDDAWAENIRRYWLRYDFGDKQNWQAKEVLPEFPSFVDRFAAALKEAWTAAGIAGAYTVVDPADRDKDISTAIKALNDVWLSRCVTNPQGHPLPYEVHLEEQMKLGALMSTGAVVTWKEDVAEGRVAVETVDPRRIWVDATGRGLYRIRRLEMDRHKLKEFAKEKKSGKAVYNLSEIEYLTTSYLNEERARASELTGHGSEITSNRNTLVLHEIYADIVGPDGSLLAPKALTVMADEKAIIRGPEKNPFWHGRDWVITAPLVSVPLSPYGRSYAEDFGQIADTFTKITNLILDAVTVSSMKVFAMVPEMLANPGQAATGVWPGKTFMLTEGVGSAQDFMHAIDLGSLGQDTVQVWQSLKTEMTEAAGVNEIGLGQFAPHSRTSATEVAETQHSSNALVRSVAQSVEQRLIEPTLDLVWKTGLQHMKKGDSLLTAAVGEEMFAALHKRRKELVRRPITFQARGISTLIQKGQKLRSLLQLLQTIAASEILLQQFFQVVDPMKLIDLLFDLANVDITKLKVGEREAALGQLKALFPGGPGGVPTGNGGSPPRPAADMAQMMGIAR